MNEEQLTEEQIYILTDVLDREGCHSLPKSVGEWKALMLQTAHKCLLQGSSYALEAFRTIAPFNLKIPGTTELHNLYEAIKPSASKIIKILKVPDNLDRDQSKAIGFFKQ